MLERLDGLENLHQVLIWKDPQAFPESFRCSRIKCRSQKSLPCSRDREIQQEPWASKMDTCGFRREYEVGEDADASWYNSGITQSKMLGFK